MALNLKTTKWLYVEHYLYGLVLAAAYNALNTVFSTGTHDYKGLLWSFLEAIALPIITKAIPNSAFNKVANGTGVSSQQLASLTTLAQNKAADAFKSFATKEAAPSTLPPVTPTTLPPVTPPTN